MLGNENVISVFNLETVHMAINFKLLVILDIILIYVLRILISFLKLALIKRHKSQLCLISLIHLSSSLSILRVHAAVSVYRFILFFI